MDLIYQPRDPHCAYVGRYLHVPRGALSVAVIRSTLELTIPGRDGVQNRLSLWGATRTHLVLPREYLDAEQRAELEERGIRFIVEPNMAPRVDWHCTFKPRDPAQERAWQAVKRAKSGTLWLACGKGKTIIALMKLAHEKTTGLIVTHRGDVLTQWHDALLEGMQGLREEDIGWIGAGTGRFDWDKPVVLATVQSLLRHINDMPELMRRHYGWLVFDEAHVAGAPQFSQVAFQFPCPRLALTATPLRPDGREVVYFYHMGRPFHKDTKTDLRPKITFFRLPTRIDLNNPTTARYVLSSGGEVNSGRLLKYLSKDKARNKEILRRLRKALEKGRRLLCLSPVKRILRILHQHIPGSVLITQDVDARKRVEMIRGASIIFCTTQIGSDAIDDESLDTTVFLFAYGAERASIQGRGRSLRPYKGKFQPRAWYFDDYLIPQVDRWMQRLRQEIRADMVNKLTYRDVYVGRRVPEDERALILCGKQDSGTTCSSAYRPFRTTLRS